MRGETTKLPTFKSQVKKDSISHLIAACETLHLFALVDAIRERTLTLVNDDQLDSLFSDHVSDIKEEVIENGDHGAIDG